MEDQPGLLIAGKYKLLERAGEGGMATVWRAQARGAGGFSRIVAVKRILPRMTANEEFVAMFLEEARVGAQLPHPNIVQLYDFGIDERALHFLVMEWIEGLDLGRYMLAHLTASLLPPWPLVCAIGIEVLRGLGSAHDRCDAHGHPAPVFHRDVTPQNVLIGANGVVKLSDFGLSRAMDRARMTRPDIIKGKVGYLAPEVTYGEGPTVATDLFGVGVVLWEALAGRRLFRGNSELEVLLAARRCEIPALGDLRPDIPRGLAQIVHRALAFEPAQRFSGTWPMIRALAELLRAQDVRSDPPDLASSVVDAATRLGVTLRGVPQRAALQNNPTI